MKGEGMLNLELCWHMYMHHWYKNITGQVCTCRGRLEAGTTAALRVTYTPPTSGMFACEHFTVQTAGGRQVR